jgi:hypothetical protein
MRMKKVIIIIIVVIVAIGACIGYRVISSRPLSPKQTVTYNHNGLEIKVVYCRPFKKDRLIFGEAKVGALVPYGKYWRLGANEATEITLSKDVTLGGKPLKAGSYRMYAVPNELSWGISLNSELGKWGFDEPDYSSDVLRTEVPVNTAPVSTEQLTIALGNDSTGVNMEIAWDVLHVHVPIKME